MKKIIYIILIISIIVLIAVISFLKGVEDNKDPILIGCVQKGNICNEAAISSGVPVEIKVNDSQKIKFYVIDNTEDNMTLLMAENLEDNVNWHNELINIKGPVTAMEVLGENTKSWSLIENINNYTYDDYGLKYFNKKCSSIDISGYDCSDDIYEVRGYKKIVLSNSSYIEWNLPEEDAIYNFDNKTFKARLITVEELTKLLSKGENKWLISNLNENEGYWTLSSSTVQKTDYNAGAYAVINLEGKPVIEPAYVDIYNNDYKIGIRPVIVVDKR
ncbi:MAG: hypothetical protein IJO63_01245 [Bacilli bacterium]|nr:hypothetical protein [Bacilli bacterium]